MSGMTGMEPWLESLFSEVDVRGLLRALSSAVGRVDVPAILTAMLEGVAVLFGLLLKLFTISLPIGLALALASYLSCWYLDIHRAAAPQPRWLGYTARNACNSMLLLLLGNSLGVLALVSMFASVLVGGGHPDLKILAINLVAYLLPPLLCLAFARWGMRFSRKRSVAAWFLFTLLFAAFFYLETLLFNGLPVIR